MSIPRFAIERPVMMTMISAIIILLGGISLTRLPVDLLPDISQPTISVRVNYAGVGPLEMEELVTRPLEQQLSAVSGLEQMNSIVERGQHQVQPELHLGPRPQRGDGRHPHAHRPRARPPARGRRSAGRFRSSTPNSAPIMGLGVESVDGSLDRVELRELAEHVLSPRLERVPGVAAVTVNGGLRRQIHVELSREKITALDLSVDRVVNVLRTENQNIPIGEIYQGDRAFLLRSQGQFENLEQIANLVVLTSAGVPVYLKDIADVKDTTEDNRSILRINGRAGRPDAGHQAVGHQHRADRRGRARRDRADQPRGAGRPADAARRQRQVHRALDHRRAGARDDRLGPRRSCIIFLFLRNFRSTLIVCTSIPISVVGTFALLYFAGLTLNTMTFGGLALGVGMVVDAAIVVLENSFRHMEHHGKDRMTASIDGSEEVWSAILASILTHIAVFVPLLFLDGRLERHVPAAVDRRRASRWRCRCSSRSRSCRCSARGCWCCRRRWTSGGASAAKLYAMQRADARRDGRRLPQILHLALAHRPTVVGLSAASVVGGGADLSARCRPSSRRRPTRARSR